MKQTLVPSERYTTETLQALPLEVVDLCERADSQMQALEKNIDARVQNMAEQVTRLQALANSISGKLQTMFGSQKPLDRVVVVERFQDDGVSAGSLHRESLYGALTLKPRSFVNANANIAGVWIDKSASVGIPGNNMVVKSIDTADRVPRVTLVGETDNHANILSAFDSSPDTWFEWENVVIKASQPLQLVDDCAYLYEPSSEVRRVSEVTADYGWTVSVAYPGDERLYSGVRLAELRESTDGVQTAQLTLEISLDEPVSDVWFELVPYHVGGRGFRINWLMVSEDGVSWTNVASNRFVSAYNGERSDVAVRFYIKRARYLRIQLYSPYWYRPSLGFGHPFHAVFIKETRKRSLFGFVSLGSRSSKWVERRATREYAIGTIGVSDNAGVQFVSRVVGGAVGMATGLSMKILTQAIGSAAVSSLGALAAPVAFLVGALVLGSLFLSEKVTREVERTVDGMDVFTGWRSAIGIREIRLARRTYERSGEWVSPVYRLSRPVHQLVLMAHDDVPDGTEIRYQLRVGDSWKDVDPHSQSGRVWNLDEAVTEVQVRIQMTSEREEATPVVYGFMLEGYGGAAGSALLS